jgi:uracil-DNA glycosylase
MKEYNYYFKTQLYGDNKVGIPSTLKDLVIRKIKSDILITILIIVDNRIMSLNWNEIEFLSYETTSGKYNNYQHGDYKILWLNFVDDVNSIPKGLSEDTWNWELALLNRIHYSFYNTLRPYLINNYKKDIILPIAEERKTKVIYPDQVDVLKPFTNSDLNKIKVVILGQDPYPAGNHATGIAFATKQPTKPASLIEIEKAIKKDYPELIGDIDVTMNHLIKQGIFLLNSSLTVKEKEPNSHVNYWKTFIDLIMTTILLREKMIIFVLMGNEAKRYKAQIESTNHKCICVEHPAAALYNKREWEHNELFKKIDKELNTKIKWLKL